MTFVSDGSTIVLVVLNEYLLHDLEIFLGEVTNLIRSEYHR